jgi:hypothetical protein
MRTDRNRLGPDRLSEDLQNRCKQIAREINDRCGAVRDEKILAARVRICSGYYDSDEVLRVIADHLLSEGQSRPASS